MKEYFINEIYIDKLYHLSNITIELNTTKRQHLLLTGKNGSGKTSLTGDGSYSATSSVLNLTGHKDEYLCRKLSEQICAACQTTVVCTGGVHIDQITKEEICEIMRIIEDMGNVVIRYIKKRNEDPK